MLPIFAEGAARLGIELTEEQLMLFQRYYDLLIDWTQRVSITGIHDGEGIQRRHFLESAALLAILRDEGVSLDDASAIDVGSGAGIPGVPLKILAPGLRLTLVEAKARRAEFLRALLDALDLPNVLLFTRRSEEVARDEDHRERYDVAVAKALAPLPTLVELTLPFLRVGGLLVAPKGGEAGREVGEARRALEEVGGVLREVIELPLAQPPQRVVLVEKTQPTPKRYPRRPGIPAKRPL